MSAPSGRHLLVTGAAGFIGAAAVQAAVARGHRVTAVARTARDGHVAGVRAVAADLSRPGALDGVLEGVDAVVHCAASLGGDAAAHAQDTIGATAQLVASMAAAHVRRIVLVSSVAVYDFAALAAGQTLDEQAPLAADHGVRGPYIAAKLAQEGVVRDPSRDLDWRILRPGLVFGPRRAWFYDLGLQLHPRVWVTLAGAATLPLTYVENCAAALVAAAEGDSGRTVANVVDDDLPTRRAYVAAVAAAVRPSPVVLDVPWAALSAPAAVASRLGVTPGVLHPARLAARCKPLHYSNRVLKQTWAWRPAVPFDEALVRTLA